MQESDLFPIIVGRKGGGPIDCLDQLKNSKLITWADRIDRQASGLQLARAQVLTSLYAAIHRERDPAQRKILIQLRRDIHDNRDLERYRARSLPSGIESAIKDLLKRQEQLQKTKEIFRQLFTGDLRATVHKLLEISNTPFLMNGLLFASTDLLDQVQKFLPGLLPYNKKIRRVGLSVLRYLTRSVTKTTPFSSFNSLFFLEKGERGFTPLTQEIKGSHLQITNLYFYYLKKLLLQQDAFRDQLPIRVNPTVRMKPTSENNFHFFVNHNNHETFKRLAVSPVLSHIDDLVRRNNLSFKELFDHVKTVTDEDKALVEKYLEQLIHEGFLQLTYPVSSDGKIWMEKLARFITQYDLDRQPIFKQLSELLSYLSVCVADLEANEEIHQRKRLMREAHRKIVSFFRVWDPDGAFPIKVKPQDLFYEDTTDNTERILSFDHLLKLKPALRKCFSSFQELSPKQKVRNVLAGRLADHSIHRISLLDLYESYFLPATWDHLFEVSDLAPFTRVFQEISRRVADGNLPTDDSVDLHPWLPEFSDRQNNDGPFGLHLQPADANWEKVVINQITNAHGANISRFLQVLPKTYSDQLRRYIHRRFPGMLVADTKDASVHNINNYPNLADYLIDCAGRSDQPPSCRCLPLNDIWAYPDAKQGLVLKDKKDRKIRIINFSMENKNRCSSLVRFLDVFDPTDPGGYRIFLTEINRFFRSKLTRDKPVVIPRLTYGEQITLQRKTWLVSKEQLTAVLPENTSPAEAYLELQRWRRLHRIPEEGFIKISPCASKTPAHDHHKPQYIDFTSSVFLLLLRQLLRKAGPIIEITEMWPDSAAVRQNGGLVKEYILNLD